MKQFIISLIFFITIVFNANAQLAGLKNIVDETSIFQSPFHILKKTAEKISSLGLKKAFFWCNSECYVSRSLL